jgi:glycosyltransferase involved in cell wall biosynthesis
MTTLTVLIPAYNESKTIRDVLTTVAREKIPGVEIEVVVVDDASTDGTGEVLKSCQSMYKQLITFPKNRGKGAAVIAGLEAARGDFVLVQDADMEYNPQDYGVLLKPVLDFGAELVIGSRFLAPPWTRVNYFWHMVGNRVITLLFNVLNNTTFTDIYSGFVLFKRSLLDPRELVREGWDQQAEVLSRICARARVIYEVPISYHGRSYDEGKKIRAFDAVPILWRIVSERIRRLAGAR